MAKLADAISTLTSRGDIHIIEAPEAWTQGRTLYGGMTAALCFESAKRQSRVEAPLRSAQFTFVGLNVGLGGPAGVVQAIDHHDDHVHVRIANVAR